MRWIISALMVVVLCGQTEAGLVNVNITYTGDNVVSGFLQNGSDRVPLAVGPHAENWRIADVTSLSLETGQDYQLIFRVWNEKEWVNPGGFLAEISEPAVGDVITSSSWEYAIDYLYTPSDFDMLNWQPATEWGNNGGRNTWTRNNSFEAVKGITTDAEWIWSSVNFAELEGRWEYSHLWFRSEIAVPIPEPATLALFALGLAGAGLVARRRKRA